MSIQTSSLSVFASSPVPVWWLGTGAARGITGSREDGALRHNGRCGRDSLHGRELHSGGRRTHPCSFEEALIGGGVDVKSHLGGFFLPFLPARMPSGFQNLPVL